MAEASDFRYDMHSWGLPIPPIIEIILTDKSGRYMMTGKLPGIWRLLFNISAMAEASDLNLVHSLGLP